ncbi:hypothetical protein CIHG_08426 [Coccidioides immitis H538.4]|uniref:Uncharacterized protein n=1 Tax=Coccidioides immitis H538.4 TaxID=396776 RepID=A0A0J8S0B3_COCIT|nr:hypothetical protein CIHG_08426 [Coccidioides immitis H538.4]
MGSASKGPKRSVYGKNPPPRTIEQRRLRARSNWDRLFGDYLSSSSGQIWLGCDYVTDRLRWREPSPFSARAAGRKISSRRRSVFAPVGAVCRFLPSRYREGQRSCYFDSRTYDPFVPTAAAYCACAS